MGCSSAPVLIVNAEVGSMGGVVEGGVGIANKSSPHKAAIEKVQSDLRQECGVRDERRRELDFLEKGGNPLDYKLGITASVSVQSTSIIDQHPDQIVTSEAKGSLAFTASPHGDSVESSGRPGTTPWDPNSADNLLLFDAENEFSEGGRTLLRRSSVLQSEQSLQMDVGLKIREHGESATFCPPRKAYRRRNRSRPNRDGARSSSTDVNPSQGFQGTSFPPVHGLKEVKVVSSDADNENIMSNLNLKPASQSNEILPKAEATDVQDVELDDGFKSSKSGKDQVQGVSIDTASDVIASENPLSDQLNQQSLSVVAETLKKIGSDGPGAIQNEEMSSAAIECQPIATAMKVDNQTGSCQMNGFGRKVGDDMITDSHNDGVPHGTKVLDSESSCTQTSLSNDGNNDNEMCTIVRNLESNGNSKNQTLEECTTVSECAKFAQEMKDTEGTKSSAFVNNECVSASHGELDTDSLLPPKKEVDQVESPLDETVKDQSISEGMEAPANTRLESVVKATVPSVDNPGLPKETSSDIRHQETIDVSNLDPSAVLSSNRVSNVSLEAQSSPGPDSKLLSKIDEESILKEAQVIEAKRKRIAELSVVSSSVEIFQKSHWDYVLEEMVWLANDFAQERIWKLASASQLSYRVAVASRLRRQESHSGMGAKRVAHSLSKAVMEFWHSIELQVHETSKELEQHCQKNGVLSVRAYAVRFLKCDKPDVFHSQAEVPLTPDRISDPGILDLSWEDSLTEENLFYTVPPGAVETYRMAIESHVAQYERIGSFGQEELEISIDAAPDFESHDNGYGDDEGETNIYGMPMTFEGKSSRYGQKKRKHLVQAYGARPYEVSSDLLHMQSSENKLVTSQFGTLAKRPGSNINVSIPTKRMRTASRRVISPFGATASGCIQVPIKTDASSCDTNSFQDDQSTLRGGLVVPNSLEVESAGDFEKQLPFDSAEVSTRPKKKKKPKHLQSTTYEQRWTLDSNFQNEQFQRDPFQKRTEIHQREYNGLPGEPNSKKPKLMRQSQDNSFDNLPPSALSVPSPVGSQMSNMSTPNKFIKMLGGRDRGRKPKLPKMPSGQSGSGSPWSLFEDQALVVLAHDLGPNWELVSDAFNSTLHFKYIFRKSKECKERHICLMDKSSGDGADSADDSGSSQPYPSTLPGIPKGSARQLFQRLQGPMEEDTLKSHFEKIIMIGQKQHYRKTQNDNQDPKQFQRPHGSHAIALSQVCPNNPSGGPVLTPLDLCDANFPSPDVLPLGYQGPHSSGLPIPNQATVAQMLPASSTTAALQGASNLIAGNNFSSSPGPLNTSARDARYGLPRSGSLPAEEHQRMHLYNQMITGRNIPPSGISSPGAVPGTDRGPRMLPSTNGMGVMSGANRNMPIARPGMQGIPSSMVNSGSMVSAGLSSGNMHNGVGAAQGSSMVRPNMMRPDLSQDSPRQTLVSDLHSPSNSQRVSHFGGLSPSFTNQTTSPPMSSYPLHHPISPQQPQVLSPHQPHFQGPSNHAPSTPQQAYAYRLAKERQLQHRFLQQQQQQQQQQQFAASNSLITQLPVSASSSSPVPNSPQTSSPPVSLSPSMNAMPQNPPNHQMPTQIARNPQSGGSGLANQTSKPRPRQQNQASQANRQHPQQRQQLQQAKVVKGVGRGNAMMHRNITTDVISPNGVVSTNPGNQSLEKTELVANSMQSQGPYTGSSQNSVQPSRQHLMSQQKMYSGQASSSLKHPQIPPQFDNSSKTHVPSVAPPVQSQPSSSSAAAGTSNQTPLHQKFVNQNQPTLQRPSQPNRQITSDSSSKPQGRDSDVSHHPSSNFAGTKATLPQVSNSASNAVQAVSQPLADANALSSSKSLSALVSMPSNSSEPVPQAGQGLSQRPQASFPLARHDSNAQRQQQQQQPQSTIPQSQQHQQPLQPPLHSQQQAQLLQAGSGNLYGRSGDTRLE